MHTLSTKIAGPVAVIGDIHGQAEKLLDLLDRLRALPDFEQRWLVFIGDFVDRGPDPKTSLDILADLIMQHARTTAVAGNHDLAMAASLGLVPTPTYSDWAQRWVDHYDAETTFDSYDARRGDLEELLARLPEPHQQLLASLPWCVEHPDYVFIHAGLDPNMPTATQLKILQERDFSLNHPPWLCSKSLVHSETPSDCPRTVVSGHVYVPQVVLGRKRILLDTTGGLEGDLSCVLLPENQVIASGRDESVPLVASQSRSWWKIW